MDWPKVFVTQRDHVMIAELADQTDEAIASRAGDRVSSLEESLFELESSAELGCGVLLVTPGSRLTAPGTRTRDHFDRVRTDRITDTSRRAKPVVAAVEGPVLNGGFHGVLACDLVVASADTSFGFTGFDPDSVDERVRMLAGGGALPPNVIRELLLTDRRLDADRGERLGFVNRVCPPGEALATAFELATEICGRAMKDNPSGLGVYRRQWLSLQANAFLGRGQHTQL